MPAPTAPPGIQGALLARLPNYVGDAVMAWPALARLIAAGWRSHLLGRAWAGDLFAGTGLPFERYPPRLGARVACLRAQALAAATSEIVLFTHSFSSATEARLAGLRPLGYRKDGRGWLLAGSPGPLPETGHLVEVYWRLAGLRCPPGEAPALSRLPLTAAARDRAARLCTEHGLHGGFVLLCPQAGGRHRGLDKNWPHFAELAGVLGAEGWATVATPGPGEEQAFRARLPHSLILPGLGLLEVAALAERCSLAIANDGGLGHLAAAAGAPLLSLFGPTDPARVRPWSERAEVLGGGGRWPSPEMVRAVAMRRLAEAVSSSRRNA